MIRSEKDFADYVKHIRKNMVHRNNDRKVVVVSANTKKGEELIWRGSRNEGTDINAVYGRCSDEKRDIFKACYDMYSNDPSASDFSIVSHNCHSFSVSWLDALGMTILTRVNEYHVIFNE